MLSWSNEGRDELGGRLISLAWIEVTTPWCGKGSSQSDALSLVKRERGGEKLRVFFNGEVKWEVNPLSFVTNIGIVNRPIIENFPDGWYEFKVFVRLEGGG